MATPQWEDEGHCIKSFAARLNGRVIRVHQEPRSGAWFLEYEPALRSGGAERLAATNARDAQVEAIEFVRGWATELVAQAAELRGTMEETDA